MDSLPAEPQEKPKNTGVGSLTLLLGNLPNPGIEPGSPALQADSLPTELSGKPATCRQLQIFLKHARVLSHFSHVQLFSILWTVAYQASLSMGFFMQEYWAGFPCLLPRDLPDPDIELFHLTCINRQVLYH